jgi:hypothetical protein
MGEIITFPAERVRRATSTDEGHAAQILFFTGVRYEREEPKPQTRARKTRRRRKHG